MPKTYVINTNQANNHNCESDMIKSSKCSAYCSPWKYYIDEIEANDFIFLFSNGNGIIARGIATGITELGDYEGNVDEEHYMNLDRFEVLNKKPLEPSRIIQLVGQKMRFNQMVVSLPHRLGIILWQYITKNCI